MQGAWRAWPFQTAILDVLGDDDVREVIFQKSARVGYTKMLLAAVAYNAEHKHRNQVVFQPTDEDAEEFVKTELDPMLRDMPVMAAVFPAYLRRHKDNTLRQKKFLSSMLHVRGGKAAKNYRRLTVDVAILDELDGFDVEVEHEGSPVTLSAKRVEGATFPKHIMGSTPKTRGISHTESRAQAAQHLFRYRIPCPHCDHRQVLRWGDRTAGYGMKWTGRDPTSARYLCEACAGLFSQQEYFDVWTRGRWESQHGVWLDGESRFRGPDGQVLGAKPESVAFHCWTAYSPQATWPGLVEEYLRAVARQRAGDASELKAFVNTSLGETYEEEAEKLDREGLRKRAEDYALRTVPAGGLILTAGIDVQDNRFEIAVWAWGPGEESWLVDYTVMEANPADEEDWARLDGYLQTTFPMAQGGRLKIESAAVDTGGHFTHQVYHFARSRAGRRVYAIKGDNQQGKPVKGRSSTQDVNYRGKVIKAGVKLWHVGTDTAKDLLFGRLKVDKPGPGYVHIPKEAPEAFFDQLTAEARVLQKTASGEVYRWVKIAARNEALDCTVYAMFAAHMRDVNRYTEAMWQRLRELVAPSNRDLFADAAQAEPVSVPKRPVIHDLTADMPRVTPVPALQPGQHWSATNWR